MFFIILHTVIAVYLMYHGADLLKNPPPFGDKRGLSTWRTREGEDAWKYGNRMAARLYLIGGAILGGLVAWKISTSGEEVVKAYNYVYGAFALVMTFSIVPISHAYITKKTGRKGPTLAESAAAMPKDRKSASGSGKKPSGKKKKI